MIKSGGRKIVISTTEPISQCLPLRRFLTTSNQNKALSPSTRIGQGSLPAPTLNLKPKNNVF